MRVVEGFSVVFFGHTLEIIHSGERIERPADLRGYLAECVPRRSAAVLKTSTLLHFNKMLIQQKYRLLFSPKRVRRPGPKGPTKELIDAVIEMKRRNRTWGCKRIAQQIALAFGVDIDKDVVRRILATHFHPEAGSGGPSWLSFIGHAKDSLWVLRSVSM